MIAVQGQTVQLPAFKTPERLKSPVRRLDRPSVQMRFSGENCSKQRPVPQIIVYPIPKIDPSPPSNNTSFANAETNSHQTTPKKHRHTEFECANFFGKYLNEIPEDEKEALSKSEDTPGTIALRNKLAGAMPLQTLYEDLSQTSRM